MSLLPTSIEITKDSVARVAEPAVNLKRDDSSVPHIPDEFQRHSSYLESPQVAQADIAATLGQADKII